MAKVCAFLGINQNITIMKNDFSYTIMKKFFILPAVVSTLLSCNISQEDKANQLINDCMKKTVIIADSYEPVETKMDSAFTPYDEPKFIEAAADLAKCGVKMNQIEEEIEEATSSMSTFADLYGSTFSKYEYNKYKGKLKQAQSEKNSLMQKIQSTTSKIKKMLKTKPTFIGYKAVHSYRAKNNAGQVTFGHDLFFFDKDIKNVVAQYDMDSEEYQACQEVINYVKAAHNEP